MKAVKKCHQNILKAVRVKSVDSKYFRIFNVFFKVIVERDRIKLKFSNQNYQKARASIDTLNTTIRINTHLKYEYKSHWRHQKKYRSNVIKIDTFRFGDDDLSTVQACIRLS